MRNVIKSGLLALAIAGAATGAVAGVRVGIGIGVPGVVVTDPCIVVGNALLPDYCTYPVYGDTVFIGGVRFAHPRFRVIGGQRQFHVNGAWRSEDRGRHGR